MIYLIVGRTASGKDYFANLLEEKGMTKVKSHTTRPKRFDEEDTHIFITQEEANSIKKRIAYTKIGHDEYFATADDIDGKDFYIIDPNGIKTLAENMPNTAFSVIYIKADEKERKRHFIARQNCSENDAIELFNNRNNAEKEQFDEFERQIDKTIESGRPNMEDIGLPDNIHMIHIFTNPFESSQKEIEDEVYATIAHKKCHTLLTKMAIDAISLGIIKANDKNEIAVHLARKPGEIIYVTPERFASFTMSDDNGFGMFMREYLGHSDKIIIKE